MIRPEFLMVLPEDNKRVGGNAAIVLALVRYATSLEDEYNGRILMSDDAMWWRASYPDIAGATGLTPKAVRGAVLKLEALRELKSFAPGKQDGDQTKIYRIASDQELPSGAASDQHLPSGAGGVPVGAGGVPSGAGGSARGGNSSSLTENRRKSEEQVEARSQAHAATERDLTVYADKLIDRYIPGNHTRGGARRVIHGGVKDSLRRGLPEPRIIEVIREWLGSSSNPYSHDLCKMLDAACAEAGL